MKSPHRWPSQIPCLIATLFTGALALLFLYPFFWMFLGGFKTNREIFRPLQLWPEQWRGDYYAQLFGGEWFPFTTVFLNSLVIALAQAGGAVLVTSLAGYAFARHRFRGRELLFVLGVLTIVLPQQAIAVPLFSWLNSLRLTDHLAGVILPGIASGLGLIYFTLVFRQIPDELIEAARLAGAGEWGVYRTVLPLITSSLLSFGLIQFILAWHQHLIPLLIVSSPDKQTLPLALASLYGSSLRFPYAVLLAGSSLTLLPAALLFAFLYRRFKSSLSELLLH